MATLFKDVFIDVPRDSVWDAIRDVGALHTRLVPGFVLDTKLEPGARVVRFGNGLEVREPIISVDDERRRMAWSAEGGATTHYNAVLEARSEGHGTRVTWTIDLLPDSVADRVGAMQEQGLATMKQTLERSR